MDDEYAKSVRLILFTEHYKIYAESCLTLVNAIFFSNKDIARNLIILTRIIFLFLIWEYY